MKIILLKDIHGLGKSGNTVVVKPGYARNYLVPYGMAIFSNIHNIQVLQSQKRKVQLKEKTALKNAQLRVLQIKKIGPIVIFSKSKKTGQLFGSIGVKEIANAIIKLGVYVEKHELIIQDGMLRRIGKYNVIFQPYKDVSCYLIVKIIFTSVT